MGTMATSIAPNVPLSLEDFVSAYEEQKNV